MEENEEEIERVSERVSERERERTTMQLNSAWDSSPSVHSHLHTHTTYAHTVAHATHTPTSPQTHKTHKTIGHIFFSVVAIYLSVIPLSRPFGRPLCWCFFLYIFIHFFFGDIFHFNQKRKNLKQQRSDIFTLCDGDEMESSERHMKKRKPHHTHTPSTPLIVSPFLFPFKWLKLLLYGK